MSQLVGWPAQVSNEPGTFRELIVPSGCLEEKPGAPLTDPIDHCYLAEFRPDGRRFVTVSDDDSARIWDIIPLGEASPIWLRSLADAIAGQHLNDRGRFEP